MKSMIAVIFSAVSFAILGLIAAWGIAEHYPAQNYERATTVTSAFIGVPLGGTVVGLLVGCIGAAVGRRSEGRRSFEKDL